MTIISSRVCCVLCVCLCVLAGSSGVATAQESKSAALAKEVTALLDAKSLDAVAAKETGEQDHYVAALYYKGGQLLIVEARYSVPLYINQRLEKKEYREAYIDLNSASVPESKVLIVDAKCDGLAAKRDENQPFDTFESATRRVAFDGDWKKQKLDEAEYMKIFSEADAAYTKMLTSLLAQLKK